VRTLAALYVAGGCLPGCQALIDDPLHAGPNAATDSGDGAPSTPADAADGSAVPVEDAAGDALVPSADSALELDGSLPDDADVPTVDAGGRQPPEDGGSYVGDVGGGRCGDGACGGDETHETCREDCPRCGNGLCEEALGESHAACAEDCPPVPANDLCLAAEEVAATGVVAVEGTTSGAHRELDLGELASPDVYFRFRLVDPASLVLRVVSDPVWDTSLYLLEGSCDRPEVRAHGDDDIAGRAARVAVPELAPGDYLVAVTGYGPDDSGAFTLHLELDGPASCGDGVCAPSFETAALCPADCPAPAVCGDGVCQPEEDAVGCHADCPRCGDGRCDRERGETTDTCPVDCPEPPANDTCGGAVPILNQGDVSQRVEGTTTGARPDLRLVCAGHANDAPEVVYVLELERPVLLDLRLTGVGDWDTFLYVLSDDCDDGARVRACNDDAPDPGRSHVEVALEAGQHWVAVAGFGPEAFGEFSLEISAGPLPVECGDGRCDDGETPHGCPSDCLGACGDGLCGPGEDPDGCPEDCLAGCGDGLCEAEERAEGSCPQDCEAQPEAPANDLCGAAVELPTQGDVEIVGTTVGAGHEDRSHWSASPDVYYSFTLAAPASATLRLRSEPPWDTHLRLLSGPCGAGEEVGSNDEGDAPGSSLLALPALAPGPYLVVVAGFAGSDAGPFSLSASFGDPVACGDLRCDDGWEDWRGCPADCQGPPPPANDRCEDALDIGPAGEVELQGTTEQARHDLVEHWSASPDVFFSFSLAQPASAALALVGDPSWDTFLYLLMAPCGTPIEVARDDHGGEPGSGRAAIELDRLAPGQYLVVVTGFGEQDRGAFSLEVSFGEAGPCGDGVCAEDEDHVTCRTDCPFCGDGVCAGPPGETDLSCPADCLARPDNDSCEQAIPIPAEGVQSVVGRTFAGRMDLGDLSLYRPDVFYSFVLDEPASLIVVTESELDHPFGRLLRGTCDAYVGVDQDHWAADDTQERTAYDALEPGPYVVAVIAEPETVEPFTLTLTFGPAVRCGDAACAEDFEDWQSCPDDCDPPPVPDNDVCPGATPVQAAPSMRVRIAGRR